MYKELRTRNFDDLRKAYEIFRQHGVEGDFLDALHLFDLVSNGTLRRMDLSFIEKHGLDLHDLAQKRKKGIPLEYILGIASFMGLMFHCTSDVLIPRQETELLVKVVLEIIRKKERSGKELTLIDVGTGCGNIAVSLAVNSSRTTIIATDVCPSALMIARRNVKKYGMEDRIRLFCGDLFEPFKHPQYKETVDIIVCNPPYIPSNQFLNLSPEITNYEPKIALDAGYYGIDFFRRLIGESLDLLRPDGLLLFEVGPGQEKLVKRILEKNVGYHRIRHIQYDGNVSVLCAAKKMKITSGRLV